jgi:D-3-phosphoglycerate dehydrogenase
MREGAYLVNTAFDGLIDEDALVDQLTSGHLAGAALDVHQSHPIPPTSPFLKLNNVILTPHVGGATLETIERHSAMMLHDIERFIQGKRPRHLVNPQVWRRRVR